MQKYVYKNKFTENCMLAIQVKQIKRFICILGLSSSFQLDLEKLDTLSSQQYQAQNRSCLAPSCSNHYTFTFICDPLILYYI